MFQVVSKYVSHRVAKPSWLGKVNSERWDRSEEKEVI
jgi:hypothetical protein